MKLYLLLIALACFSLSASGALVTSFVYFDSLNRKVIIPDNRFPLKMIVHGWNNMGKPTDTTGWVQDMKNLILSATNLEQIKPNVMVVNWDSMSIDGSWGTFDGLPYVTSANNCPKVGQEIVNELIRIKASTNVHCIGHSLGAHVCGFASKKSPYKFPRISGLDPAGPNFQDRDSSLRLDKADAGFVDIYHTNSGNCGISHNIGHADFYPNDSGHQPGCGVSLGRMTVSLSEMACSHDRAYEYYIASIKNINCFKVYNKLNGKPAATVYGYYAAKTEGEYTLTTLDQAPFCKA